MSAIVLLGWSRFFHRTARLLTIANKYTSFIIHTLVLTFTDCTGPWSSLLTHIQSLVSWFWSCLSFVLWEKVINILNPLDVIPSQQTDMRRMTNDDFKRKTWRGRRRGWHPLPETEQQILVLHLRPLLFSLLFSSLSRRRRGGEEEKVQKVDGIFRFSFASFHHMNQRRANVSVKKGNQLQRHKHRHDDAARKEEEDAWGFRAWGFWSRESISPWTWNTLFVFLPNVSFLVNVFHVVLCFYPSLFKF